jgi:hypothetical protein
VSVPADVETFTRRTTGMEQQILDLRGELAERDEDLAAARGREPRTDGPGQPLTSFSRW